MSTHSFNPQGQLGRLRRDCLGYAIAWILGLSKPVLDDMSAEEADAQICRCIGLLSALGAR